MLSGAYVPELEGPHALHQQQELQEGQTHLFRGVVEEGVKQGEELLQKGVAQTILKDDT